MMIVLRNVVLILFVIFFSGCMKSGQGGGKAPPPPPDPPLTYTAPPDQKSSLFDVSFNPSNSLHSDTIQLDRPLSPVELMDRNTRAKYDKLLNKKAKVEKKISELDNMRRGADYDIIKALSSGGANMGKDPLGSEDIQSVYEDPHIFIQNKQWEREHAVNEIVEKQRDLAAINIEIDQVLNEAAASCFPASTAILMGDGSVRKITDVKVGDSVMVYDIARDELAVSRVKEFYVAENTHTYRVNGTLEATAYERFLTRDGWRKVRDLSLQDELFNGNSFEKVSLLEKSPRDLTVYNLHIESSHNFFVTADGDSFLLVHNTGGGGGGGK